MKYAPYSFSSMNTYIQCPRKFKYNKIDKIDPGPRDMTALLKGSAIHDILENFPKKSNHKLAPKYIDLAIDFIKSELGNKYLFIDSTKEHRFGITKNLEPCSFSDPEAIFRGAIDHICIVDNTLHIIDWKTGKYKEEKYQDYNQLIFYAVYFFIKYKTIQEIKISFVYVEHNLENSLILLRENLKDYAKEILGTINEIENDTEFNRSRSRLCDWCEFKEHCDNDFK